MMRTTAANVVEMVKSAAFHATDEICGALIGTRTELRTAVPLVNEAARRAHSFHIPAREVLRMERLAEQRGELLVGFYHSHPTGDAQPSSADVEQALPGYLYLIASRTGALRAWQLRDDRTAFDEVMLETP